MIRGCMQKETLADMESENCISPSQEEAHPIKKPRIASKSNDNIQLPLDVVAEILSRLSTNSLARLRCVCKQWLSLTYDPRFLKSHHERSSSYMIIAKEVQSENIRLYDFSNGDGRRPTKSLYKLDLGRENYKLSNFFDGLTCVYEDEIPSSDIYLLNPMTRELEKLPMSNVRRQEWFCGESFGLGIDMITGQYKIVRLFCPDTQHILCEIHTVGTSQWRYLGEAPFQCCYESPPVFLHGALHWIGYEVGYTSGESKLCLFKFNIEDEKFGPLTCTPCLSFFFETNACLKEFRGKLWLMLRKKVGDLFELWTLKDYYKNTWVKEYRFRGNSLSSLHENFYDTEIVVGETLLVFNQGGSPHVICYNPRTGSFCKHLYEREFSIYKDSLISPKKLFQRC